MIDFILKRTKRKNILIKVGLDGEVFVYAPKRTAESRIKEFVCEKETWIEKNVNEMKKREKLQPRLQLLDGESLQLLGDDFVICATDNSKVKFECNNIFLPTVNRKESFIKFLKQLAKVYLESRVREISEITGLKYNKVTITSAKTRWGSCNASNDLSFTFRLMFCKKRAVDYIIIHELCHTVQKNHSKKFWNVVQSFMPEYKQAENYLKEHVAIINII